jgi:hypothetical protein
MNGCSLIQLSNDGFIPKTVPGTGKTAVHPFKPKNFQGAADIGTTTTRASSLDAPKSSMTGCTPDGSSFPASLS